MNALTKEQCKIWRDIHPILSTATEPLDMRIAFPHLWKKLRSALKAFLAHDLVSVEHIRNPPSRQYPHGYIRKQLWSLSTRGKTVFGSPEIIAWSARWDRIFRAS